MHIIPSPDHPQPLRLVLLPAALDANGEVRVALLPAGPRPVPTVFPSVAAAIAALRDMQVAP